MTPDQYKKEEAEILRDIPPEIASALSYMAYEEGHSGGYDEVLILLMGYTSALRLPLKLYAERVKNETLKTVQEILSTDQVKEALKC